MSEERERRSTRRLIRLAREGDSRAREELFDRNYPDLLQAARFRLGPALRARMDTLDLAQTVYFDALRDLPRFRHRGKGSFHRWLLGILENKIRSRLSFFRAKRRDMGRETPLDSRIGIAARATSPVQKLLAAEDRQRLESAMDRLSGDHREIIVCRYYLRMPWREISDHFDRTEEACQMLCRRALLKLREGYNASGGPVPRVPDPET